MFKKLRKVKIYYNTANLKKHSKFSNEEENTTPQSFNKSARSRVYIEDGERRIEKIQETNGKHSLAF